MPADLHKSLPREHREALGPSWADRLTELTHPGWARTASARRIVAAALALTALALFFRGDPDTVRAAVVVAAHDLHPGQVLTDADLRLDLQEAGNLPDGAVRALAEVTGRTVAGPTRAGEALTDVRVLGPRLAAAATGTDDARVVPLRLADPGVAELLREGDRVDVLTVDPDTTAVAGRDSGATILATGATVVLVTPPETDRNQRERVVMLALPAKEAHAVAAASLTNAITVTFQ